MKTLSFTLTSLFLISFFSLKAQTVSYTYSDTVYSKDNCELITILNNPTFDSVKVFPKNPTENDYVKLVVFISNENDKKEIEPIFSPTNISNDSISLFIPSSEISPFPSSKISDTILIGKLSTKDYKVILLNRRRTVWGGPVLDDISYIDTAKFTIHIKALTNLNIISNNFNIYPNPTSEKLKIENKYNKEEIDKISIHDVQGKMIMNFENKSVLNIKNLENGIYFLQINLKNGTIYTQQIIKE